MSSLKYKCGLILGFLLVSANSASSQWQDHPINCYSCEGDECASSLGRVSICQIGVSNSQTCVTVFGNDPDNTVISRGCTEEVAETHADYCDSNSDKCIRCSSNGCNTANVLSEFIQCLSCDSTTDRNCVLNPSAITSTKLCHKSCMVALYARNVTNANPTYELSRSCLDDKDLDDREICSDGEDAFCKACEGEKCNVARLPEDRFNCYYCANSEDCEDPISEECVSHNEDDQCYFMFDEFKDLIKMGCRSEFESDSLEMQIKDKKLLLCDGADCNYFNNYPQPKVCNRCDSGTDENCALEPTSVESSVTCGIPYTQCFSKVSDVNGGRTLRGCLSDLNGDEFYECLQNGNKDCQSCSGEKCNREIVPADRIQCQRCSSTDDSDCHKDPSTISVCPLYTHNDTCVSAFTKGVTTRGCGSEFTCDLKNPKSCQICSSTGCNTNNVKKSSEESYGIFQRLPLNCYTCSGEECEQGVGLVRYCEGNTFQDCVTVFDSNGKVIRRGCEDIVDEEQYSHCSANPELCFKCKSNGCNTITDATDYFECIFCDTSNNPDCVRDVSAITKQRKCTKGCVTALYPRSEDSKVLELVRTCLDDIESDDVEDCGKDSKCVQCAEGKCNTLALPETRLSCNICDGDDCEYITPKLCSAFSETDQCFMLFDSTLSVSRMGCKSELTESEVRNQIKQLFLCDGDNCNHYENLPGSNYCAYCNSTSNALCATSPSDVTTQTVCRQHPYTQCYSRVAEDGTTARGCLLSLQIDDFIKCLEGDGAHCQPCLGSSCNKQIFPENRQQCHRCSSSDDADCESLPYAPQACPLYVESDNCVTKVTEGITKRGCESELSCGTLGRKDCRVCSEENCNTVDLIEESVGDPGLWQDLPINCYHCDGEDCANSVGLVQSCIPNNLQTCTTVFSQVGEVIARGCSDVVATSHGKYCDANPSDCLECKSSGCNLATSKADYVDCIFCDGRTNANCSVNVAEVGRTRKCHKACMTALYPRTKDADASYDLTRSCLDDKDLDHREKCEADPFCRSCTGTTCNTQLIPEVRKTCYHCSGDSCQLPTVSSCRSYTSQEQCFTLFDELGGVIEMGCKSDYNPRDFQLLLVLKRLFICNDDNCNVLENLPPTRSCRLCNSRTDRLCATDPQNIASLTSCSQLPITDCYTRVLDDGHTERGCLSSLDGNNFLECYYKNSTDCATCAEGLCNDEIFPADRLSCHTCNSADDPACDGYPRDSTVCLKYSADQSCVTTITDGVTHRGCSVDLTCNSIDHTNCRICNTTNCNVVNLKRNNDANPGAWQGLPLNCNKCTDEECKDPLNLNACRSNINQHCMTVFGEDGTVVRRGCSDDVEADYQSYCDENSGKCFNCNSNGCNNAFGLDDYVNCIYCDSRVDKNCVLDVSAVSATRRCHKACMVALFPRSANESDIYELSRNCLDDKDLDDRDLCGSDNSLCKSCSSEKCNADDAIENRLECYSCLGDFCEDPVSQKCAVYKENDACFTLFDDANSVLRMGCTSEMDEQEQEASQDLLLICSGNNCNSFINIPQPQMCASCESSLDVECATSPPTVAGVSRCSKLPNIDCYTRVKSDGTTARGCVSDLSKELRSACLSGNEAACSTCKGDKCNTEIFPEDRLRCHKCNSIDDPNCEGAPNSPYVCPVYIASEICSSKLVNDVTYRSCGSDFICDDSEKQYCKLCNSTNCNRANLFQNNIGYPGKWQGLPINCYTCFREECDDPSTNYLRKCEKNNLQNCVTVFSMAGKVVQRGCSDTIYEGFYDHHCDNHPDLCTYCKSSGCNNADSLDDYVDCLFCDSATNPNCTSQVADVSRTRKCQKHCMTALYPRSDAANPVYELTRSCLDDKDLDDRDLCDSDRSLCKSCDVRECNVYDIVDERLECYSCLGDSCESPVSGKCSTYSEHDNCFMLFDDSSSVQRMGCTSELNEQELEDSVDHLWTCSDNNCNDFSNIPQPQKCSVCDSAQDVQCATNPRGVATVRQCSSLPNVDCYTRVRSDGITLRGCVSDLSKELRLACLRGNETDCTTCKGDACNIEIFPEDRLRCHKCNSIDDPTCEGSPNSPYVCPVYKASEICSSKLVNDVTYRSCGSDFICDDSDRQYCKLCNSTNCNRANLFQNNIGYPGKWQGLPINCYTCFREECDDPSTNYLRKCEKNSLQNCVTVFSMAGKVVQRGCSDTIYEGFYDHHCDNHPDLCTYCKSSGCNNADSLDDYVDCLFCDSATNPNCTSQVTDVSRTRKCQKQCMTALYPRSNEADPAYELSRSCLDDKDLDDRDECESGDEYCKICPGESCNTDRLPDDRLSCWRCSGDSCEDPVQTECPAYRDNDSCFILFNTYNDVVQMGCRSDFDNSALTATLRKKLLFCNGDNCNHFNIIPRPYTCLVCDSANDTLCATSPDSLTNFSRCTNFPYTSCYTRIEDGLTKRGCLSDVEIDAIDECVEIGDDVKCNLCTSEYCNIDVYPADRRSCHRCSSSDDTYCQSTPRDPRICPIYQEDDECVVFIDGETTSRGCISEFSCNAEDRDTCRICPDDNCNSVDLLSNYVGKPGQWQDLPLSCYQCNDAECQDPLESLQTCSGNNLQNCMTVFDTTGAVVKRGCSDDIAKTHEEYCDTNGGRCQICKSSGCNNVLSLDDYVDCIFCDTTTNPNCVLNPNDGFRTRKCHKQCMVALFPRSSEDDPSYELSRSCLDDKESDERNTCAGGSEEYCQACEGPSCNNFRLPDERHQCWTCRGDECENAKTQDCVSYHPEDQCYTLFDNTNSIIAMGCRSEYERAAVIGLIQAKNLLLCNGSNCNSYEIIPNPQPCVVCNSAIDPQCATNPNLIVNATTCSSLPYTGCFTRINEDGDTERGCQSSLPSTEFYGCYAESDSKCSTCTGNKCNADVYPANRRRCHRCNSEDDPNCAESPASDGVCPKFTDGESCVSAYKDGITQRGCSSELACDVSNKKTCRVCAGSSCNTQNLEHVAKDGEPGRWQNLPINCYTCQGDVCKDSLGGVQSCLNNNVQNCMTVFNSDGDVIQRGCSDPVMEVQEDWCERNLNHCYRCNSNGCNKAMSLDDYVDCVSCDTTSDVACVRDPSSLTRTRKCYQSCMTALFPRSSEEDPAYDTARTCLDDKDIDDRQTCQAGTEHLCSACENGKCNVDDLPSDRRSCFHCYGDECQLPKAEICAGYRPDDQCFIMFGESQTVIEMGCKSDFTIAQSIGLVKSKQLLLCDGDNCNDLNSLPATQSCALCNSRTDVNCAVNPENVIGTTSCDRSPYTHCYSRVLSDGATERGCLSSLVENDFYDCLIGNSTCRACLGGSCNRQVFPADRIECHICDSLSDPNCEAAPNSLSICAKYSENESCVSSLIAGKTSRGCGTALECDASNRKSCRICSSTGCNIVDLASKQDDNFGKWQDLPISCFHCEGDDCQRELGEAKKCQNNNNQDCSTVFDNNGRVVLRGCSDQADDEFGEYCDVNAGRCFNCKSNECNIATSLSDFTECVYCDTNKDKTCVTNPLTTSFKTRQCQGGCMVALYPSDSSSKPAYDLIRTCLNDKDLEDQTKCPADGNSFCKSCPGSSCNTNDLPDDRLRCYSCLDDSCEDPVSEKCPLYKEGDQCFIRFDSTNSIAEMGCLSEFRGQEVLDILKTKQVYICEGDDCNALSRLPSSQRCAFCNSADDENCAINPNLVGNVETCSLLPYTDCYTKITATGATERGCLRDLAADEFAQCILSGGDKCSHCVGNGCNRQIFPESRLRCYSCSSDIDPDCESLPTTTAVCPYIRDNEKCVSALGGNLTERACSSQLLCDISSPSTCRHCSFTGCNTLDLANRVEDENHGKWQDLPLRCHTCSGQNCFSSLGPALTCTTGNQQDCMTVFDEDGEVVRRGCSYDVEDERDIYCRQNPDRCLICKSNECNDAWELTDYVDCIYCNSETDPTCASTPGKTGFPTRKCQKGCMAAAFKASNGTTQVIRTCLDDKELQAQYQCSLDESGKECSSCPGENCNNFNYPRDRLTCHVCQGTACSNTVAEHCAAYVEGDSCFAKYETGRVDLAGCSSAINDSIIEDWKEQNKLYTCEGDSCNSLDKLPISQTCIACDSSKNVECATDVSTVAGQQICLPPINSCFSNITSGVTHRGCLQSLSSSQQTVCKQTAGSILCETCSGYKCNSEVYPSDRRRCHICNSDDDDECKANPTELSICPNYLTNNQCVVKLTNKLTERGCSSDLTCDVTDQANCRICGTDGCNTDRLDNAAHAIIANNLLLTLLVAIFGLIGVFNSNWF